MADSTLSAIRTKVRRLTHSPSAALITDAQIDEYINTFVLYDMPETLRLFSLRKTFTFYTEPNVDTYETNTTDPTTPLYNFKNKYTTVHDPIYVAGYKCFYSQSRDEFFAIYPFTSSISTTGNTGDGATTTFTGTLSSVPVLPNQVIFTTKDISGEGLTLIDYPVSNSTGALGVPGTPQTTPSPFGDINYITGAYTLNFPLAPKSGEDICSETRPYQPARPNAVLYYDNTFTVRPVPDKVYPVNMEVYARPTELLSAGQSPDLEQWWQYVAFNCAKKVFEDKMDMDSVQLIMPALKEQERLVLRRTIVQQTNERTATIYTQQTSNDASWWGWGTGQPF